MIRRIETIQHAQLRWEAESILRDEHKSISFDDICAKLKINTSIYPKSKWRYNPESFVEFVQKYKKLTEAASLEHTWVYTGVDPHKGEYWYKCTKCNAEDWIASYGSKDQLRPKNCSK